VAENKFLPDVARQKLLKLANSARSYSKKNKSGTFFMDHSVLQRKYYSRALLAGLSFLAVKITRLQNRRK